MTDAGPTFREALGVWLRVGCLGFGGPAGQIALLHRAVVEEKGWIDEASFGHALSFCMLLPGPEAQQLAVWLGWKLHGVRGGVAAGLLFILPGLLLMLALSALYVVHGRSEWAGPVLLGLKAAVVALVAQALMRIGGRTIRDRITLAVALAAFAVLGFTVLPFPMIILAAGGLGWILTASPGEGDPIEPLTVPLRGARRMAVICLGVWLAPVLLALALAPHSTLARMGVVFSGLAVVSVGGAYAALAYLGQAASVFGWVTPAQMLDGLGLAETTPGPLVLVFSFVGFIGAYQAASPAWAWLAGVAGGLMAAWATFAPSFLWIFAAGPYVERLRSRPRPARALALISAAAVGVIGHLAVWFAIHLLFRSGRTLEAGLFRIMVPKFESLDPGAFGLTALALGLIFGLQLPVAALVAVMIGTGLLLRLAGLA